MDDFDAILKGYTEGPVYYGYIFEDKKGRFVDGTYIRTSMVVSIKDGILQTLNTKYKLEK